MGRECRMQYATQGPAASATLVYSTIIYDQGDCMNDDFGMFYDPENIYDSGVISYEDLIENDLVIIDDLFEQELDNSDWG